jgi:hypothetical protein
VRLREMSTSMQKAPRNGVSLAFQDNESPESALMLVHGWGCDHTTLQRQQSFFEDTHWVDSVDSQTYV